MADNVSVGGKTISTDEVSIGGNTVHVQRAKLGYGADGTYTGDVSPSTPLPVADDVRATGGATMHHAVSAASDNATAVKTSAGTLYSIVVGTIDATPVYLKLYNKASAPTVGTDTPVLVVPIQSGTDNLATVISFPKGLAFSLGIGYGLVTGITDADTNAVSVSETTVGLSYK